MGGAVGSIVSWVLCRSKCAGHSDEPKANNVSAVASTLL